MPTSLGDLADQRVALEDLWGGAAAQLAEAVATADDPEAALGVVQAHLLDAFRRSGRSDPLVREAVRQLMPWHPVEIATLARHLAVSATQLRRRCLHTLGVGPKVLQRTLRFQGFLALAQAGAMPSGRRGADGLAGLAIDVGYAHLTRECVRLTGLSAHELLHDGSDRCACGHDHSASYRPFLAGRRQPPLRP